ncbi:MAG: hypothetical protein LBQ62_09995 [Candidatus Accumulibacter sp.]|nr:hypothetical protein [Accumulibacter sp.]
MLDWLIARIGINSLAIAFALGTLFFGAGAGWTINDWWWEAKWGRREAEVAQSINATHQAVVAALEKARAVEAAGEAAAQRQIALEAQNAKLGKEKDDALRKLTTGRACLDAPVVGLLNADAFAANGPGLRPPAGGVARAAAGFASDTDVALWARNARDQYDRCRGRIDALNAFYHSLEEK